MKIIKIKIAIIFAILFGLAFFSADSSGYLKRETIGSSNVWVIYDRITLDNFRYFPLILNLERAKSTDTIRIIVRNNRGGAVPSMEMISRAIRNSEAKVVMILQGFAASAGAHILMQGDEIYIPDESGLLWHTGSISFDAGATRIRLTPHDQRVTSWYWESVKSQIYLHPDPSYRTIMGQLLPVGQLNLNIFGNEVKLNLDGKYRYISKKYWEFFLTGQDAWVKGETVCKWNLEQYPRRDDREKYLDSGCKLTGIKGQLK